MHEHVRDDRPPRRWKAGRIERQPREHPFVAEEHRLQEIQTYIQGEEPLNGGCQARRLGFVVYVVRHADPRRRTTGLRHKAGRRVPLSTWVRLSASHSRASFATLSQKSGKLIPIAAAPCGMRLSSVIPGNVFASRQ